MNSSQKDLLMVLLTQAKTHFLLCLFHLGHDFVWDKDLLWRKQNYFSCGTSMVSLSLFTKLSSCTTSQGDTETQIQSANDFGMFMIIMMLKSLWLYCNSY
jgi:hypothetical protein